MTGLGPQILNGIRCTFSESHVKQLHSWHTVFFFPQGFPGKDGSSGPPGPPGPIVSISRNYWGTLCCKAIHLLWEIFLLPDLSPWHPSQLLCKNSSFGTELFLKHPLRMMHPWGLIVLSLSHKITCTDLVFIRHRLGLTFKELHLINWVKTFPKMPSLLFW